MAEEVWRRATTGAGCLGYVFLEDLGARRLYRGPTCDPLIDGLGGGFVALKHKGVVCSVKSSDSSAVLG